MEQQKTEMLNWIPFYSELASKLLVYKNNRAKLIDDLREVFRHTNIRFPFNDEGNRCVDICPFTVFGSFNKRITEANRIAILTEMKRVFSVNSKVPTSFAGIPLVNNMKSWFYGYSRNRAPEDIPNLWNLFESAIAYADEPTRKLEIPFIAAFDHVRQQNGIVWNVTMGLFWIRPFQFLSLDSKVRNYIEMKDNYYHDYVFKFTNLSSLPVGDKYVKIISELLSVFTKGLAPHQSFPELSIGAYETKYSDEVKDEQDYFTEVQESVFKSDQYWVYSPGRDSEKWDDFYENGIMAIAWDELGDLKAFQTKNDIKARMQELWGDNYTYINSAHATWQFAHEIKNGDIIFAKKGLSLIVGRGIVQSDYLFDSERNEYKHYRKVKWTHKGEWKYPGQAPMKTLTNISSFPETVSYLENYFPDESLNVVEEKKVEYKAYTKENFLDEVFMSDTQYNTLVNLLLSKKNIIIQGAPGVGKTFAAKRLAYSIIGSEDKQRVKMVQFHQSYNYEDFVVGYRPSGSGFEIKRGPFYNFCQTAQMDDNKYFFIIDEINRGNLSKIFGELLMLIEADKRGQSLYLPYTDEEFVVPDNVYIIGMMNTADRSLALIDYALRRRFAFFDLHPAYDNDGFKNQVRGKNNPKLTKVIEKVVELNTEIKSDPSLGAGFQIGHSYFCFKENEVTNNQVKSVIQFEIIPLLREYWFDEQTIVERWEKIFLGVWND